MQSTRRRWCNRKAESDKELIVCSCVRYYFYGDIPARFQSLEETAVSQKYQQLEQLLIPSLWEQPRSYFPREPRDLRVNYSSPSRRDIGSLFSWEHRRDLFKRLLSHVLLLIFQHLSNVGDQRRKDNSRIPRIPVSRIGIACSPDRIPQRLFDSIHRID